MASSGRSEQSSEAGAEFSFPLVTEDVIKNSTNLLGDTEDDGSSEADGEGAGDIDGEAEVENNESERPTITSPPKSSLLLGMTEPEIRTQQAALASEYSQLARVLSRALEKRVSLTLKRLERMDKKIGHGFDGTPHTERPPLTKLGKLLSYQISSIQSNSRHEALNIWRDFYRQKIDLREKMGSERQRSLAQLQQDYTRSALARNTDVPVLDWISANLDIVHYLRTQVPLAALDSEDVQSDLVRMRKTSNDIPMPRKMLSVDDFMEEEADDRSEEADELETAQILAGSYSRSMKPSTGKANDGLAQLTSVIVSPDPKKRKTVKDERDIFLSPGSQKSATKVKIPSNTQQHQKAEGGANPADNLPGDRIQRTPSLSSVSLNPGSTNHRPLDTLMVTNEPPLQPPLLPQPTTTTNSTLITDIKKSPGQIVYQNINGSGIMPEAPSTPNHGSEIQRASSGPSLPPTPTHTQDALLQQRPHHEYISRGASDVAASTASPQGPYSSAMLPTPHGLVSQELPPSGIAPQGLPPQGLISAGYPYYSGYPLVQGYPQFQYPSQPTNIHPQQPQNSQGYVYGYQNQWLPYVPQGTAPAGAPWQAQYSVWPPHPQ